MIGFSGGRRLLACAGLGACVASLLLVVAFSGVAAAQSCSTIDRLLNRCPPPPPPAPDPGGSEEPNQPVPPPGKAFGFNHGYQPPGDEAPDASLAAMRALRVTHLRYAVNWANVAAGRSGEAVRSEFREPIGTAPESSWLARLDQTYLDLRANGITPVLMTFDAPLWASTFYKCNDPIYQATHSSACPVGWTNNDLAHFPHPDFYAEFREFVVAVARRYPDAIIEGHNEPDYAWRVNRPNKVNPTTAGEIQCELYQAVRSVDQRPVLSMSPIQPGYATGFIARANGCYTGYSFHAYAELIDPADPNDSFGEGSDLAQLFADLRSARSAGGDSAPIWITETGYTFPPDRNLEDTMAYSTRRLYNKLITMPDVGGVLFHTLRDGFEEGLTRSDRRWHWGFNYDDWTPKGRMCTFVAMAGTSHPGC